MLDLWNGSVYFSLQVFFRAGVLSSLDRQVEDRTHDIMVKFQAHIRGWLGREMREKLELQHAAAHVIQRNIRQGDIINNWSWWKLLQKVRKKIYCLHSYPSTVYPFIYQSIHSFIHLVYSLLRRYFIHFNIFIFLSSLTY